MVWQFPSWLGATYFLLALALGISWNLKQAKSQITLFCIFFIHDGLWEGVKGDKKEKLQLFVVLKTQPPLTCPQILTKLYLDLNFASWISSRRQHTIWKWPIRMRSWKAACFWLLFWNTLTLHCIQTFLHWWLFIYLLCHIFRTLCICYGFPKIFWVSKAKIVIEIEGENEGWHVMHTHPDSLKLGAAHWDPFQLRHKVETRLLSDPQRDQAVICFWDFSYTCLWKL